MREKLLEAHRENATTSEIIYTGEILRQLEKKAKIEKSNIHEKL